MKHPQWKKMCLPLLVSMLMPAASAQIEKLSQAETGEILRSIPETARTVKSADLKQLLGEAQKQGGKRALNAARSARDFRELPDKSVLGHYAVMPMSDLQRLPDAYPVDGVPSGTVRIIAAQDEYEPGSFVVYPFKDLGKVQLTMGKLRTKEGREFPASQLDLKVVKVWYQNHNGWYSYFGDTKLKLTPELLLNDEDLIFVDTKKVGNFARLTEKDGTVSHQWITPYFLFNDRAPGYYRHPAPFCPMKLNFKDADTLQKVTLSAGEYKQFFLTVQVTEKDAPGLYNGSILLDKDGVRIGEVPVSLRVLPFRLPDPKTYYDINRDFYITAYNYSGLWYIAEENGDDYRLAEKQFLAMLKNLKSHNQYYHWIREGGPGSYNYKREFELIREAGLKTDPVFTLSCAPRTNNPLILRTRAKTVRAYNEKLFGHNRVYLGHGDEPPARWFRGDRPVFEAFQNEGFRFIIACTDSGFYTSGFFYDFINLNQRPEEPVSVEKWNQIGKAYVGWYAQQHVGTENPCFNRRQYGLAPYLKNYSAFCNYAHHFGPYGDAKTGYKPMVFAYGHGGGVLDTLAWEGFREGVDDIRYATLAKQLAAEAEKSPDIKTRYAGGKLLQFLTEMNGEDVNMDTARLELIRHILVLRSLLKGDSK